MDALVQDLRYACRSLGRTPAFTVAVIATLALGIGANTAIYSVVDGVLLRPAPFHDMSRLAMVWETDRKSGTTHEPSSVPDYFDFRQRVTAFTDLAALAAFETSIAPDGGEPRRLAALGVSHELLPMLGVRPLIGQHLAADQDRPGGSRTVMISEALWEREFARDPSAVGRTIRLSERPYVVAGVLPRDADFGTLQILQAADYGRGFAERGGRARVDVWFGISVGSDAPRDNHPIIVLGRLAPGVSLRASQQQLTTVAAELERQFPGSNVNRGAFVEPLGDVVFGPVRPALMVLLGAVGIVLLVACVNVANLLLVRGAGRVREITVRIALGAGARRLMRQFMAESMLLTFTGAAAGLLLAQVALQLLMSRAPATLPRIDSVGVDGRVLSVTLCMSVVVAVLFGCLPVLQTRRDSLHADLQSSTSRGASSGRTQGRFRSALVVSELAMAVMLMVGAGLLVRSLWQLQSVNPGFNVESVLKAEFQLPGNRYPQNMQDFPHWTAQQHFYAELESRLAAEPGVQSVALASANPLSAGFTSSIRVVGREREAADWPEPSIRIVSASYFAAMGVPMTSGRPFTTTDAPDAAPVVVINETASRRFFNGRSALGQQIDMWGRKRTVVGIVGNERIKGVTESSPPAVYLPLAQSPTANALLVRTVGDPARLIPAVRRIVRDLDPLLPLYGVEPLAQTLSDSFGQRRFTMITLGAFAAVALLLAVIGVHGVLSYTVSQRTRELGIRMALGADAGNVRTLIVGQGARLAALGLGLGLLGAFVMTGVLSSLLFGVGRRDPATFVVVSVVLGAAALMATAAPARRAARTDPLVALRAD